MGGYSRTGRARTALAVLLLCIASCVVLAHTEIAASAVPSGFSDTTVLSGRTHPTAIRFAPDGRIFVAEKSGKIWSYAGLADTSPTLVADLSTQVDDYWDRGLLGLAIPPNFPTDNSLYVLYTYDAAIGATAPRWSDTCPTPPGATTDGCLVSGRLSRVPLTTPATEQVLIEDWCQQFPSHSVGTVLFGRDGYLYASAGDGASFNNVDYGQFGGTNAGFRANPCGDPPGGAGTALTPPSAEGGALRSQSPRRAGGPTTLDGTIIRIDPVTGAAAPGNPFAGDADPNKARVLAYGLRNPFRITARPGTDEIWVGDVGWNTWEEISLLPSTAATTATNFGWPCYEGSAPQPGYQGAQLTSCSSLYASSGAARSPVFAYNHSSEVVAGDGCPTANGSSVTGLAFYPGGRYPAAYTGALFFADHSRNCIWAMLADTAGNPDPTKIQAFVTAAAHPVDLQMGPAAYGSDLFYVDFDGGTIHRVSYTTGNVAPTASFTATPDHGQPPLTVQFDASASSDPEGGALSYAWDFGDGTSGTGRTTSHTYANGGSFTASLTVTDPAGATGAASLSIAVGPQLTNRMSILDPSTGATRSTYRVGDTLSFSGSGVDPNGQPYPPSAFTWTLRVNHCTTPTACHVHDVQTLTGATSGTFTAPDHSYPYSLTVQMTVATGPGTTADGPPLRADPATVALTFRTNPGGLRVAIPTDGVAAATPVTQTFVIGHALTVSAPSPQTAQGGTYNWQTWSDRGAQTHTITAPAIATTYTATYRKR